MSNPSITHRLAEVGSRLDVAGDGPFLLSGDAAWFIEAGSVDVFWARTEGSEAVGRRTHLFRAASGQLLLAVEPGNRAVGLVAVGVTGTRLIRVEREALLRLAEETWDPAEMAELLDGWVTHLCQSVVSELPPTDCVEIVAGEDQTKEDSARRVRPQSGALWITSSPGNPSLLGRASLEANGSVATPFPSQAWLEIPPASRYEARRTLSVLEQHGEIWDGLAQLHSLCLDAIVEASEASKRSLVERLNRKTQADHSVFSGALGRIARTLEGQRPRSGPSLDATHDDPLLIACQRIGEVLGFEAVAPPPTDTKGGATIDPLEAIARTSRFRTRLVLLRDDWWQREAGPLLAYVEESGDPIALLPAFRGYVAYFPLEDREAPLTEELANSLNPQAFTFYPPFPAGKIGMGGLVRFAMRGSEREVFTFVLMGAALGLLGLVTPIATRAIFNDIIPGAARGELLQLTLVLLAIAIANAMFEITKALALVRLEGKSGTATIAAIWDRLISLPAPFFRPYTTGNLASRAMGIDRARRTLSGQVTSNLLTGVFSVFHLGYLFFLSAKLAWWALLLMTTAFALTIFLGRLQIRIERHVSEVRNRLSGTVFQLLSSISKLRVAGAEVLAFAQWANTFSEQRQYQFHSRTRANVLSTFNAGFPLLANLVIFAFAAPLILQEQELRTGDFLAFLASFTIALQGILAASQAVNQAAAVLPMLEQARPILEALPEDNSDKTVPAALTGAIDIDHVSFRYAEDGPRVLDDVTLSISPGEFVALVGPSGSGKSTLLRQLLAFEEPLSGSIYYDGQDLAGLDKQAVRAQLGVVLQDGGLMAGDIFTNIIGSSRATLDDAWQAARLAGLDRDISNMPMQMHTVIAQGGGTLSGGQRQRLMIARALVRKPRILYFDEATSALDNRTQAIVTESLDKLQATRLVVAHRLSTIRNADRICVLDQGRLVESGTYQELMDLGGVFHELAKRQMA